MVQVKSDDVLHIPHFLQRPDSPFSFLPVFFLMVQYSIYLALPPPNQIPKSSLSSFFLLGPPAPLGSLHTDLNGLHCH